MISELSVLNALHKLQLCEGTSIRDNFSMMELHSF